MYKTDINKINISSTNFIDTEKLNDLSIGEDNSELLVVNSDAIFTGTLSTSGGLVGGSSGGGGSGIVNNRIDGDLTICEDSSDLMVINSEAKFLNNVNIGTEIATVENIMINNISRAIPVKPVSGDAGKVLKANAAGTGLEYGTISKITGSIVQTQHTIYRDTYTKSANGWEGLPFFVSITPSSINSKILISTTVHIGADSATDSRWYGIRLYKKTGSGNFVNFTNIPNAINIDEDRDGTGDPEGTGVFMLHTWGAGSADYDAMVANVSNSYLDTPGTTSAVEYKLYWAARLGEGSPNSFTGNDRLLLNRSDSSTDAYRGLPVSFIQAQEIYIP
jgi:hypothetical protein